MNTIRVLLADDHEGFRRSLANFLRNQAGVEIIGEAIDGVDAIEQTEKLCPDLVLMDLEMPMCDGFEATREIKLRVPDTKVVILSMHSGEIYRRKAWRYAADGFIDKASMKSELLRLIESVQTRFSASTTRASA